MRRTFVSLLAILAVALIGYPLAAGATDDPTTTPDPCAGIGLADGRAIVKTGWHRSRWRDRTPVKPAAAKRLDEVRACLPPKGRAKLADYTQARKEAHGLYRAYRQIATTRCHSGPLGFYAIPCYIIACESGFSWHAANPTSSAVGPYQILDFHGRPWPVRSFADKLAHHRIAASLSLSAWLCA